jgi:hypothetical protein
LLLFFPFNIPVSLKDVLDHIHIIRGYDFASQLTLGTLLAALYFWCMREAAQQKLLKQSVLAFTEYAIVGVLTAAFW